VSSTRILRLNELIQRELSALLRKDYQTEAASITITGVEIAQDLKAGRVLVAVTGDDEQLENRLRWLAAHAKEFRFALGRVLVLRHMPVFTFIADTATARGNRILGLLDEIAAKEKAAAASSPPAATP
jgi:ribosome-binding factor A